MTALEAYPADPKTLWPVATVTIKTSSEWGAGTDANVSLRIIGTRGSSRLMEVDATAWAARGDQASSSSAGCSGWNSGAAQRQPRRAPFQSGASDTFRLQLHDVGEITEIEIGHDGSGADADWGLDCVSIQCDKGALRLLSPTCLLHRERCVSEQ